MSLQTWPPDFTCKRGLLEKYEYQSIIFTKLTQQAFNRDKRELSMSIVRQVGYEVDERHTFVIRKDIGQQVGVKLYNVIGKDTI